MNVMRAKDVLNVAPGVNVSLLRENSSADAGLAMDAGVFSYRPRHIGELPPNIVTHDMHPTRVPVPPAERRETQDCPFGR